MPVFHEKSIMLIKCVKLISCVKKVLNFSSDKLALLM